MISQRELDALPNAMIYAIAKPSLNGEGHDYLCGDHDLAALPKYKPGRTMLKDTAILCSLDDPESDGIAYADGDNWVFVRLKDSIERRKSPDHHEQNNRVMNPDVTARFAPFEPFTESAIPQAPFPVEAFPEPFRAYCKAAATSYQVDVSMTACCVLAVLSAIFQKCGYWVQVSRDWRESVNLYQMITAAPSERKSPTLSDAMSPLMDAVDTWNEINAERIEWQKKKIEVLRKKLDNATTAISKKNRPMTENAESELRSAQQELREAEKRQLKPQEWIVDDATPEALAIVLQDNDETAALLSGEGGSILGILAGRYSAPGSGANIDIFLKGYSVEPTVVHRIKRQTITLKHPRLTVLLMAQPSLLSDFVSNDSFSGRGLCARFLYSCPPSQVGKRSFMSDPVPNNVRADYEGAIEKLTEFALDWEQQDCILTMSKEALSLLEKCHNEIEPRRPDMSDVVQAWSGKHEGNICRIAALLYLAQHDGHVGTIDADVMRGAIQIGEFFAAQAEYVFSSYSESIEVQNARYILKKLLSDNFKEYREAKLIKRSVLFDKLKCSRIQNVDVLVDGLKELEQRGYILQTENNGGKRGRPSPIIVLNPEGFPG